MDSEPFLPFGEPDRTEFFGARAPIIKRGLYSYSTNGLAIIGVLPRSPANILRYIERQYTPGVHDGLRGQPGIRKPPNFFRAHLMWYGVKYNEDWTKDHMEETLVELLSQSPPPDIAQEVRQIEREMSAEYREACIVDRRRRDQRVLHQREISRSQIDLFRNSIASTRYSLSPRVEASASPPPLSSSIGRSPRYMRVDSPVSHSSPPYHSPYGSPIPTPHLPSRPSSVVSNHTPSPSLTYEFPPSSSFRQSPATFEEPPRKSTPPQPPPTSLYHFSPPSTAPTYHHGLTYPDYSESIPSIGYDLPVDITPHIEHSPDLGYSFELQYSQPYTQDTQAYPQYYYSSPPLEHDPVYTFPPVPTYSTAPPSYPAFLPPAAPIPMATPPDTPSPTLFPIFSSAPPVITPVPLAISPIDQAFVQTYFDSPDAFIRHHLPFASPTATVVLPFIHENERMQIVEIACDRYRLLVQSCESKPVAGGQNYYDMVLGRDNDAVTRRRTQLMLDNEGR